jgi:DNA-binding MarR family transcriptional regulator
MAEYQRLAEFRFYLRRFLHFSHQVAHQMGLHTQQYQLLQTIMGMPEGESPTIANLAARLFLRHNSAVELVDRTIEQGFIRRVPDPIDNRRILLHITPSGEKLLASMMEYHLRELDELGPELIRSLRRVLSLRQNSRARTDSSDAGSANHSDENNHAQN